MGFQDPFQIIGKKAEKLALKEFKTESKRILDLMIHSIYTHKEIFIRELISNASDAIDKRYYKALSDGESGLDRNDYAIAIELSKESRTLSISDNGIGMTKEELENNLGVIAQSGSLQFKKDLQKNEEIDIIGQFGVGFYSAFMVSDHVVVESRAVGQDEGYRWESTGLSGYEITPCEKPDMGTTIRLHIKQNTEDEQYDEFLEPYHVQSLVKKYSDYIRYPIRMDVEKSRMIEGTDKDEKGEYKTPEYESYVENEVLNSMVPIWKKSKDEVTQEDYNNFYKDKFNDWQDPLKVIRSSTEGTATFDALLFIPEHVPMDYYSKDYEKGLQLYASGVMIMEKCPDLLPDYFSFVKGIVDSQDLSLNISREMLQHDRQLQLIAGRIEKKLLSELTAMLKNDREKYESFFEGFGLQLKYGMYDQYGANKDKLKDLALFYSSSEKKMVTLSEYVSRMKEDQTYIYYGCGESYDRIMLLPQVDAAIEKGYELLCLKDNVDEFVLKLLREYEGKEFRNVSADDVDFQTEEEKEETKKLTDESKDLLKRMTESLHGKVKDVRLSTRLQRHPVCITTDGEITMEMEKVINAMPEGQKIKADRVLEINPEHAIFQTLQKLYGADDEKLEVYADILYQQALLIEGLPIDNPVDYADKICALMQ